VGKSDAILLESTAARRRREPLISLCATLPCPLVVTVPARESCRLGAAHRQQPVPGATYFGISAGRLPPASLAGSLAGAGTSVALAGPGTSPDFDEGTEVSGTVLITPPDGLPPTRPDRPV